MLCLLGSGLLGTSGGALAGRSGPGHGAPAPVECVELSRRVSSLEESSHKLAQVTEGRLSTMEADLRWLVRKAGGEPAASPLRQR